MPLWLQEYFAIGSSMVIEGVVIVGAVVVVALLVWWIIRRLRDA